MEPKLKRLVLVAVLGVFPIVSSASDPEPGPKPILNGNNPDQTKPLESSEAADESQLEGFIGKIDENQERLKSGEMKQEEFDKFMTETKQKVEEKAAKNPDSAPVQTSAARVYIQAGDLEAARSHADHALSIAPNDPFPLVTRGIVSFQQGDYPAAEKYALRALGSNPGDKAAFALFKLSEGRKPASGSGLPGKESTSDLRDQAKGLIAMSSPLQNPEVLKAGRRATDHMGALKLLNDSMTQIKLRNPDTALSTLQGARSKDPAIPDIYMQRGLAYAMKKDSKGAEEEIGNAIALWKASDKGGDSLVAAYALRADLRRQGRNFAGALADAEAAVTLAPGKAPGYFYRAKAREGLGEKGEAILADYKRAAEFDPAHFAADYQDALARLSGSSGGSSGLAASRKGSAAKFDDFLVNVPGGRTRAIAWGAAALLGAGLLIGFSRRA